MWSFVSKTDTLDKSDNQYNHQGSFANTTFFYSVNLFTL